MTYNDCLLLTGDKWHSLSDAKKCDVLQAIENHMAEVGGRTPCKVEAVSLRSDEKSVTMGFYNPLSKKICINSTQFAADSTYGKTSEELIKTCLHEGRHAYQHEAVNGNIKHLDDSQRQLWKENMKPGNYISYEQNPRGYMNQPIEADARDFENRQYREFVAQRNALIPKKSDGYSNARDIFNRQMESSDVFIIPEMKNNEKIEKKETKGFSMKSW